jgi:hypothetical protein
VVEPNNHPSQKNDENLGAALPAGAHDHARYEILLERYLDGELGPPERAELFEHIELCEQCREVLEAEEALVDHLSRIPRLMPPSDLRAKILEEASREREILMQGGLLFPDEEEQRPAAPHRRVLPGRFGIWVTRIFLLLSTLFFLLAADVSPVPGIATLQRQLRESVVYLLKSIKDFLRPQAALPVLQKPRHEEAPNGAASRN